MRVVVFEDDHHKWEKIKDALIQLGIGENGIRRIEHVAQFLEVSTKIFDLCIIDLKMPTIQDGQKINAGADILGMLDYSGNKRVPVLAITAFPDEVSDQISKFKARGCIVYDYDQPEIWKQALEIYIAQAHERGRYDYIIFTAIKKERDAYITLIGKNYKIVQRNDLDVLEFELSGKAAAVVLFARMGLVNATATVARVLEMYRPSIVAMSGICAGIGESAILGQLLVTDVVWEYQSGKWIADTFEADPYQVTLGARTRSVVAEVIAHERLIQELEATQNSPVRPEVASAPKFAVFTTGSAVIASKKRLKTVKKQHRKVSGLDMEIFGVHRAAELSGLNIHTFSAKVVVDKADEDKGDLLHKYGCSISAAFVIRVIGSLSQK